MGDLGTVDGEVGGAVDGDEKVGERHADSQLGAPHLMAPWRGDFVTGLQSALVLGPIPLASRFDLINCLIITDPV